MNELRLGDLVEMHGLVKRPELNGRLCTLVCFHNDVGRWQLQIDGVTEVVRARASNLRRDRIEVVPGEGAPFCVMRAKWSNPQDADISAERILVQHVRAQRTKTFEGAIIVHMDEQAPRTVKLPAVTILPSSIKLWDGDELMRTVGEVLPSNVNVQPAPVLWDEPSERDFCLSMQAMIMQAHNSPSDVYIAVRTIENTRRFAMLHVLSGESPDLMVPMALLGFGTVICAPTEAIAFHTDNMIKLPTSLSLDQAVRKIADMVQNGIETPCPICLEVPSASEPTVFMPCACKVAIHLSCMQRLYDNRVAICPVCRSGLGELDVR